MTDSLFETKIKGLLKSEKEVGVLYFGQRRLYYDDNRGDWVVRGGNKEQNKVLYSGTSIDVALLVLEKGVQP